MPSIPQKHKPPPIDRRLPASARVLLTLKSMACPDGLVRADTHEIAARAFVADGLLIAMLGQLLRSRSLTLNFLPDHPSRVIVVLDPCRGAL
ncbi:MAG: hypothetical protein E6Q97_31295 [Desulfurellales bacterium]|nr:MAG: hypothetical protein E6Q97_31295 [Desulfurellales bacterium]